MLEFSFQSSGKAGCVLGKYLFKLLFLCLTFYITSTTRSDWLFRWNVGPQQFKN